MGNFGGVADVDIPPLGLGTLRLKGADGKKAILRALQMGYRHLDTATAYGNEEVVGQAIRESGLDRKDVFITTKVWHTDYGRERVLQAFDESRARLGVDYVDLYLIHWPTSDLDLMKGTWESVLRIRSRGDIRYAGVSNFLPRHIEALRDDTGSLPQVNQIELHPWLQQTDVTDYLRRNGIAIEAWSPLGKGDLLVDGQVDSIARMAGLSPGELVLRWHLQKGHVVIPKASSDGHLRDNLATIRHGGSLLGGDVMGRLDSLDRGYRIGSHPDSPPTGKSPYS